MLLPQLLNPRAANQHQHLHQQQHQQHIDRVSRNQPQFFNSGPSSESSTNQPSSANSNQSFRQPSGTRLQFIVPGEQFDLYG
jgi:hypothetical protein